MSEQQALRMATALLELTATVPPTVPGLGGPGLSIAEMLRHVAQARATAARIAVDEADSTHVAALLVAVAS